MIAAVICEMSFSLPPSMIKPPRIPPKARISPKKVAVSGRSLLGLGGTGRDLGAGFSGLACPAIRTHAFPALVSLMGGHEFWAVRNQAAKFNHFLDHFIGRLQHDEFLSIGQSNHGIGRSLHVLDEVRVEN